MSSSQGVFEGEKLLTMNTNTYRLSNTTYSEVAPCLPLPNLPIYLGASTQELSLFEDVNARAGSSSAVLSQAGKIAELLKITDISYLSLREEARNESASLSAEPGSLLSAVLHHDPGAFDYIIPGPVKERGWRNLSSEKRSSQENSHGGIQSHNFSKGASSNLQEGTSLNMQTPMSARKSRMIRKDNWRSGR